MESESQSAPRDLEVLIVENIPEVQAALVALVAGFGVRVRGAADAEAAFQLVLSQRPDLILCDLSMPGREGYGFVKRLRHDARFRNLLTIGIGSAGTPAVAETRRAGFDGHVAAPMTATSLARLLDRALDIRHRGDQPQGA